MYFLLKMVIFQPAMLVYQRVQITNSSRDLQQWRLGERIAQGHFINRDSGVATEAVPGHSSEVQGTQNIVANNGLEDG